MFALFTALVGFLGTLVLAVVLLSELMPRSLAEWQRATEDRPLLVGWIIFAIAVVGGYIGYHLGS